MTTPDASVAQYGPTPDPTCLSCAPPAPPHGLPHTGLDVTPLALLGVVLVLCGVALARLAAPRRWTS